MTVIEVLSKPKKRSSNEIGIINGFIEALRQMDTDTNIKTSLENALLSICDESISKNCRSIIKSLLTKGDVKQF